MKHLKWCVVILALFLAGCNVDLYSGLQQGEANQMLALLMLHNINAQSERDEKTGKVTIKVEKKQFINAVELLRQHGLPKPQGPSIESIFPSGQLVTSPEQEQAKIVYIKEQQLEGMLDSIDGVVNAKVSIAEQSQGSDPQSSKEKSASVYIQYSPEVNMSNFRSQIISLVHNAISGLEYDRISLFLQKARFRYKEEPTRPASSHEGSIISNIQSYKLPIIIALAIIILFIIVMMVFKFKGLSDSK